MDKAGRSLSRSGVDLDDLGFWGRLGTITEDKMTWSSKLTDAKGGGGENIFYSTSIF